MTRSDIAPWRQVLACLLLMAGCGMLTSTYSIVAVPLDAAFHPSRMTLMLAMTIMAAGSGALSPIVGNLMDRLSLRVMMLLGALLMGAGFAALSLATSFAQVLVIYGLFMAPANVLTGPLAATVLLTRWFDRRRGAAIGIAVAGIAVGSFIFPPIIQTLLDGHDWREALRLLSLVLLAIGIPAALLVTDRRAAAAVPPDISSAPAAPSAAASPKSLAAVLADPAFWLAALFCAIVMSGMKGVITNVVQLALGEGIARTPAALLISIYAASGFTAKLAFAAVADWIDLRILIRLSLGGFALGVLCLAGTSASYPRLALGISLIGMFGGFMVPMQSLLVPRLFGTRSVGRVSGLLNLVVLLALLSTPPLFGGIFDLTGSYRPALLGFAGVAGLAILLVRFLRGGATAMNPSGVEPMQPATAPAAGRLVSTPE